MKRIRSIPLATATAPVLALVTALLGATTLAAPKAKPRHDDSWYRARKEEVAQVREELSEDIAMCKEQESQSDVIECMNDKIFDLGASLQEASRQYRDVQATVLGILGCHDGEAKPYKENCVNKGIQAANDELDRVLRDIRAKLHEPEEDERHTVATVDRLNSVNRAGPLQNAPRSTRSTSGASKPVQDWAATAPQGSSSAHAPAKSAARVAAGKAASGKAAP
jgi:hypothetical protein